MNADKIRARALGKLARAKGGHARKLRAKLGLLDAPVASPVVEPEVAPVDKKKTSKKKTSKK